MHFSSLYRRDISLSLTPRSLPVFLVIQPLTFKLPLSISRILRKLFIALRIQDNPNASPTHGPSVADEKDHSKLDSVHPSSKLDKRLQIKLDLVWAPLLGVLLLLITTTIGSHEIVLGIAGSEGVKPYDVLILFMCVSPVLITKHNFTHLTCPSQVPRIHRNSPRRNRRTPLPCISRSITRKKRNSIILLPLHLFFRSRCNHRK